MGKGPDILSPAQFAAMFPRAVPGAIRANRDQWERHMRSQAASNTAIVPVPKKKSAGERAPRPRKQMNKTEAAFFELLKAGLVPGQPSVSTWEREGITLRWPDGMRYTPDFNGWQSDGKCMAYEVKGPYIHPKDLVKFRAARCQWTGIRFEMHQRTKEGWKKLL